MGKKIAVLITDEFEDSEFTSPAEAFRKAGHEVITIEKEAGKTVTGHKGEATVTIDESIDNVSPSDFDALLLPGGHSPDSLRGDERFQEEIAVIITAAAIAALRLLAHQIKPQRRERARVNAVIHA